MYAISLFKSWQSTFGDPFFLYNINTIYVIYIHFIDKRPIKAFCLPTLPNNVKGYGLSQMGSHGAVGLSVSRSVSRN